MDSNTQPRILFMGTPSIAKAVLEALWTNRFNIVGVVSQPDKPSGRGQKMTAPPVAEFATNHHIPLWQPQKIKDENFLQAITELKPDITVVVAYGKILPSEFLKLTGKECVNVHASLLPEYRGAAPINHVLLDGKSKTGVALMRVVQELDAGAVFAVSEIEIEEHDNAVTLLQKMADSGGELLCNNLQKIYTGSIQAIEQDHARATYASKLTKEMAEIFWDQPAQVILGKVRGLVPWPVAQTNLQGKKIKIHKARLLSTNSSDDAGTIIMIDKAGWIVTTGTNDILIESVQLEGKPIQESFAVANGLHLKKGIRLGE